VAGELRAEDVEGLAAAGARVAVFRRSDGRAFVLGGAGARALPLRLDAGGFDFFTLAAVERGVAVFGLLDKYVGPAGVVSQSFAGGALAVRLREAGDFGAWLERQPARVEIDGRRLPPSAYSYGAGLLRVPRASFGERAGERELRITFSPGRR